MEQCVWFSLGMLTFVPRGLCSLGVPFDVVATERMLLMSFSSLIWKSVYALYYYLRVRAHNMCNMCACVCVLWVTVQFLLQQAITFIICGLSQYVVC